MKITGKEADKLSHKWRSEEQAIMAGTNTVIMDNPMLTTRMVKGNSPVRIVTDRTLKIPPASNIFNNFASVIVLNAERKGKSGNVEWVKVKFKEEQLNTILSELYKRNIQSVIVEGGAKLLNSFIRQGLWDEARVFSSSKKIGKGIKAPIINSIANSKIKVGSNALIQYINHK